MQKSWIPLEVKKKCIEMRESGEKMLDIYTSYFSQVHPGMSYETFRHKLKHWAKQRYADGETLYCGTYEGFIAHGATVQVDRKGEVVQAWIKQHSEDDQYARLIEVIRENTQPVDIAPNPLGETSEEMLEIPLFDQHFPISDHQELLQNLYSVVCSRKWEEIDVIVGQDMLHNDDLRGRTASGRAIEKVDMPEAWRMAKDFYFNLLCRCVRHAERVRVIYSKGNHEESMSWAFIQMLKAMFLNVEFEDSLKQRKCISWRGCFIGITHGAYKKSTNDDLRGQFTIQFPVEFATAAVREIHAGHLHREEEKDVYGVMCRRLSRNGETDEWSDDEGYVGANKRFMVFRWKPGRLAGIDYV